MRRVVLTLTLALGVLLAFQGTAVAAGDSPTVDRVSVEDPTFDLGVTLSDAVSTLSDGVDSQYEADEPDESIRAY